MVSLMLKQVIKISQKKKKKKKKGQKTPTSHLIGVFSVGRSEKKDRTVNHVIYAFDKETEALVFEVPVPADNIEQLREIMSWTEAEEEIYGYDLDSQQITKLETLVGR